MGDLQTIVLRLFSVGAFALLAIGVLDRLVNVFGYTLLRGAVSRGGLLEVSAVAMLFVIAVLLRQIRDQLRANT
jgi:hypothetical protein